MNGYRESNFNGIVSVIRERDGRELARIHGSEILTTIPYLVSNNACDKIAVEEFSKKHGLPICEG